MSCTVHHSLLHLGSSDQWFCLFHSNGHHDGFPRLRCRPDISGLLPRMQSMWQNSEVSCRCLEIANVQHVYHMISTEWSSILLHKEVLSSCWADFLVLFDQFLDVSWEKTPPPKTVFYCVHFFDTLSEKNSTESPFFPMLMALIRMLWSVWALV